MAAFEFITPDYFIGSLNLPHTSSTLAEGDILADAIKKYTKEYLDNILGLNMASNLRAAMETYNPDDVGETDVIWRNLTFGNIYTGYDGQTYKWEGFCTHLIEDDVVSGLLISPIANYVYCRLMRQRQSTTVGNGEVTPTFENGITSSSLPKVVDAWDEMVQMNWHLHNYIYLNAEDYEDENYVGFTYAPYIEQCRNIRANQELFILNTSQKLGL